MCSDENLHFPQWTLADQKSCVSQYHVNNSEYNVMWPYIQMLAIFIVCAHAKIILFNILKIAQDKF